MVWETLHWNNSFSRNDFHQWFPEYALPISSIASPWNFLELQIPGPHFRATESNCRRYLWFSMHFLNLRPLICIHGDAICGGSRMTSCTIRKFYMNHLFQMIQRKFFNKEEKIKWSSKNWQCMVVWKPQDANGTEIKVRCLVRVLAVAVLLYTRQIVIHEQKSKRTNRKKKNLCLSFVRTSYYLAFLVTIHLFPSCQHADNQHQSTLIPVSLFFSSVFLSKIFFVSN